jgi:tetratricopeptide (TPR) repeat protein
MSRILAVPLAALLVTACEKTPVEAPRTPPVAQKPVRQPAVTPPVAPKPPEPPVDTLALSHSDGPGVDHLQRAERLRSDGDSSGALIEARKAVADDPADADALTLVAELGKASGQKSLAAQAYERLARLDPEDAVPLIQAARMRLGAGVPAAAEALATAAVGRDEGNVEAWQVLGRAQLSQGNLAGAIRSLEQAQTISPSHAWVLNNLGFAYLRANQNSGALEVLERAAELLPEAAVVQNNLGVARERTGDLAGAKEAYARSTLLAPRYVKAQVNGQRMAVVRSDGDAGVESTHQPADGDGEE